MKKIILAMMVCVNLIIGRAEGAELYDVIYPNVYYDNRNAEEREWITDAI